MARVEQAYRPIEPSAAKPGIPTTTPATRPRPLAPEVMPPRPVPVPEPIKVPAPAVPAHR